MSTRRRMHGWQAEGAAPIVLGKPVAEPETIATAIRIGAPASWQGALRARDESGGAIEAVSDAEILAAYRISRAARGSSSSPRGGVRRRAANAAEQGVCRRARASSAPSPATA